MPVVQPPPIPPKKETVAFRLEVGTLEQLRRYAAFLGTRNLSYVVGQSLEKVFKTDSEYKAWLNAHPDIVIETKSRRGEAKLQQPGQEPSGVAASIARATVPGAR